jgi:signal transduction histidine kinase
MSHEIRTPLNAIIGFCIYASAALFGYKKKCFVNTIKSYNDNLLTIINDILDISKIDAGMIEFEEQAINLPLLFQSLNGMLSFQAIEKRLAFTLKVMPTFYLPFTQILINLAGNTIKFTRICKVTIHANLEQETEEYQCIKIAVKDTGIGIPKDKVVEIFDRFHQAGTDTTRHFGVTGLGLSIAKQFIELQGRTIAVKSVIDQGSTCSFAIPFKKDDESIQSLDHRQTEIIDIASFKNLRILTEKDKVVNTNL